MFYDTVYHGGEGGWQEHDVSGHMVTLHPWARSGERWMLSVISHSYFRRPTTDRKVLSTFRVGLSMSFSLI